MDPVRDEAERLVAAAIAAISLAARSIPRSGPRAWATGSDECCVCPVCRVIASMRDPSGEMAERLATGAGDLATAVTGILRTFTRGARHDEAGVVVNEAIREGDEFWEAMRRHAADAARAAAQGVRPPPVEDAWRRATTSATTRPMAKKAIAKKAVAKKAVPLKAVPPVPDARPEEGPHAAVMAHKAVAKKAVAKKTVAKKAVAGEAVAEKAVKEPGRKAAKKAAKKAAPPGPRPAAEESD